MTIRTSDSIKTIAKTIADLQKTLPAVSKSGRNNHQKYNYATFEDYVNAIKDHLGDSGLSIVTSTGSPVVLEPRKIGSGSNNYAVQIMITMRLLHESGEWMEIDCWGEGQDGMDKAIYKAITGGRKYALACLLGLATTDDPENDDKKNGHDKKNNAESDRALIEAYLFLIKSADTIDRLKIYYEEAYKSCKSTNNIYIPEITAAKDKKKAELEKAEFSDDLKKLHDQNVKNYKQKGIEVIEMG